MYRAAESCSTTCVSQSSACNFSALSFEERAKEDREAKIVGKPPHVSLNDHEKLSCLRRKKTRRFDCARSTSDGDDTRSISPCLTFWYFRVKPKVRRKLLPALACAKTRLLISQALARKFSCSFFRRKSQRRPRGENRREAAAHLAERSQKTALFCTIVPGARCAPASSSDIFTSRDHAGLRPAIEIRCLIPASESDFSASRRLARAHCEKRGRSGGAGASARSGCAISEVSRARSVSTGDDTRVFSPCLTFWYFWVKPKVRRKNSCRLSVCAKAGQLVSQSALGPHLFSCSFFRRKSQRRPRGENDREAAAHLAERSRKTALFCTIVPGARCAAASSPDIFTSRGQAGLRPAEKHNANCAM